jgi:hypothetical protein
MSRVTGFNVPRELGSVVQELRYELRHVAERTSIQLQGSLTQSGAAQPVSDRCVGQPTFGGVGPRPGAAYPFSRSSHQQRLVEAGLADPRFAFDDNAAWFTRHGVLPDRLQVAPFGPASN